MTVFSELMCFLIGHKMQAVGQKKDQRLPVAYQCERCGYAEVSQ